MSAGLMTTTVMSAVVVFLAGLLLTAKPAHYQPALMLLTTSGLGFILATLIYANTYRTLVSNDGAAFHKQMHIANVVSECFGVYCLVLAIPASVVCVSANNSLQWFSGVVAALTLIGYQASGASLLQYYLGKVVRQSLKAHPKAFSWPWSFALVGFEAWILFDVRDGVRDRTTPVLIFVALLILVSVVTILKPPEQ